MKTPLLLLVSVSLVLSSQIDAISKNQEQKPILGNSLNGGGTKTRTDEPRLGLNVSSCSQGNPPLRMTKNFKPKFERDIYRKIAENFDSVGQAPERKIDQEKLNEKLKSLTGEKPLTCILTLKPSGRFDTAKIVESSGNVSVDKRFISLLKDMGSFGPSEYSKHQLSYRLQLPNLTITEVQP